MNLETFGPMNGHAAGVVMKELVRRAINAIRTERFAFEVHKKMGSSGEMDDVLTSADNRAQAIYLKLLRECFPRCGIVAEEDSLAIAPQGDCTAYFTVDPLDGTKAFVRRQSHGVGTMIALVQDGQVIAAYVGDVNTREIYGFRPGSDTVHRITEFDVSEHLSVKPASLKEQYVLLRDPDFKYSETAQLVIRSKFKNQLVDGSSIGTWMARLWKQEVGGVLLPPSWETPWDSTPTYGISKKLGYAFLRPASFNRWEQFEPAPQPEKYKHDHEVLIIHQDNLSEININNR